MKHRPGLNIPIKKSLTENNSYTNKPVDIENHLQAYFVFKANDVNSLTAFIILLLNCSLFFVLFHVDFFILSN